MLALMPLEQTERGPLSYGGIAAMSVGGPSIVVAVALGLAATAIGRERRRLWDEVGAVDTVVTDHRCGPGPVDVPGCTELGAAVSSYDRSGRGQW